MTQQIKASAERLQQLEKLFHAALERSPSEREAFLDQVCATDWSLRAEVESLIAEHERGGSFSEVPVELGRIVTKALRKDREQRYQTADELARDLKSVLTALERKD